MARAAAGRGGPGRRRELDNRVRLRAYVSLLAAGEDMAPLKELVVEGGWGFAFDAHCQETTDPILRELARAPTRLHQLEPSLRALSENPQIRPSTRRLAASLL